MTESGALNTEKLDLVNLESQSVSASPRGSYLNCLMPMSDLIYIHIWIFPVIIQPYMGKMQCVLFSHTVDSRFSQHVCAFFCLGGTTLCIRSLCSSYQFSLVWIRLWKSNFSYSSRKCSIQLPFPKLHCDLC